MLTYRKLYSHRSSPDYPTITLAALDTRTAWDSNPPALRSAISPSCHHLRLFSTLSDSALDQMADLSPPARPRASTTVSQSDRIAVMGAPPNTSPTLVQGNIGQLGTMIDLLNASGQCSPPSALCSPTEPAISPCDDPTCLPPRPFTLQLTTRTITTTRTTPALIQMS